LFAAKRNEGAGRDEHRVLEFLLSSIDDRVFKQIEASEVPLAATVAGFQRTVKFTDDRTDIHASALQGAGVRNLLYEIEVLSAARTAR
jgi:hypothetical protein